jgi:reductive dehalogenase
MKANSVSQGTGRYVVGEVGRFDQKNEIFKRARWDPAVKHLGDKFYGVIVPREDKPGYTLIDQAFSNAAWALEANFAKGNLGGRQGLYSWDDTRIDTRKQPAGLKLTVDDPAKMTRIIKKAARFLGASLVGICELDRRWVYSRYYQRPTGEHAPVEIPQEYQYAIVMAFEMNYEAMKYSPTHIEGASTGMGYSMMAFSAYLLSHYLRGLGYRAIPAGNDTACCIPLAIDAGLGELSRSGLLITEEFGPRVRLSKVFTDLPLVPDKPIEFGVWEFCRRCKKCAENCPSQAIINGEPTEEIHDISNREGLLRWPINAEKCFSFWAAVGSDCANCIRVCPFNKPSGWLHRFTRWGVKRTPWLDSFFLGMDDLLGYGKHLKARYYWE